jgi:hypothetical protein
LQTINKEPQTIVKRSDITGIDVMPDKSQMLSFVDYWKTMGADDTILTDKKEANRQIIQKWFRVMVVRNDRFPKDIPVLFVLDRFFNACIYHKIQVKGHNLMAHTRAFNEFMERYGQKLYTDWWHARPDKPKELTVNGSFKDEEIQSSNKERIETLKNIYGDNMPDGIKSLIEKLK